MRELRYEVRQQVLGAPEEQLVQYVPLLLRVERQIADSGLDQILEEVRSEGQLGRVLARLVRDLDQQGGVVDLRVGDVDPQADVPSATPAARAHQRELALGKKLVQAAYRFGDRLQVRQLGELRVAFRVDPHDVSEIRNSPVGDVPVRREQHPVPRDVPRNRRRRGPLFVALGAALEQIEVLTVGRELDVHRHAEPFAKDIEERGHLRQERRVRDQSLEGDDRVLHCQVLERPGLPDPFVLDDRQDPAGERQVVPDPDQELGDGYRFQRSTVEIDDVDHLRRIAEDFVRCLVHPQSRLAGGEEHGKIVGHPVHGPRPQPGDDPNQSVLAPDPRRPPELVVAERDP